MKPLSLTYLLQKLSGLGLETIELLNGRNRQNYAELSRDLCEALLQLKGEASSVVIAEEIIRDYQLAEDAEKQVFFRFLFEELGADPAVVEQAIAAYQADGSQQALQALRQACGTPRLELLRTLNTAPQGTLALIAMREDLRKLMANDPVFPVLDHEMLRLFHAWFNRGFLELRRIDWQTPALILEKLIQYESVHAIKGWPDLRRRLERDRRCYGFFHPAIPDVPLIFVEAALTDEISGDVTALLHQDPPADEGKLPTTAVFYSINNCLQGLRGVSFGSFLIKQVIEHLVTDAPHITRYVTLSPVPGFMHWLAGSPPELEELDDAAKEEIQQLLADEFTVETLSESATLRTVLPKLCARYLINVKSGLQPKDPVARFHLGNGARLERINWLADSSSNGLAQAAGLMVNYAYDRKNLGRNHEAYVQKNELVYSPAVKKLLA